MSETRAEKIEVSAIQNIPHHLLLKGSQNMRTVRPDKAADKQLIASIRAAGGVYQNLVVAPSTKKPDHFEVNAGGRRWSAIGALVKAGVFAKDHPVPCRVQLSGSQSAVSLAENLHAPCHPADEFAAYAAMLKQGMTEADIAEHFGTKQQHVKLRLRLAEVHPSILGAYRKGEINLETVMAFTLADTKKQQLSVFKELMPNCSAWRVRQQLTGDGERSDGALARYVGLESYRNAGGQVVTDLFESLLYLIDGELLQRLAAEKLEKSAERLRKRDGWANVEVDFGAAHKLRNFHRLQPEPMGVPNEVTDALTAAIDARTTLEDFDGEWTEEREADFDTLSEQIEALETQIDGYREFTDEQKATAKCLLSVSRNGKLQIDRGLVTRAQANRLTARDKDTQSGNGATTIPNALANDLGATRQQIAQAKLANSPKLAGDVLLLRLCQQVLGSSRWESGAIEAGFEVTLSRDAALADTRAAHDLAKTRAILVTDWMDQKSAAARLAALRQLTPTEKNRLLAYTVAACLKVGFGGSSVDKDIGEAVLADLTPDFAKSWRPSASNYFKRLTKAKLLDHGKLWFGDVWLSSHESHKKGELVTELDAFFNAKAAANLSAEHRQIREHWLPVGFDVHTKVASND